MENIRTEKNDNITFKLGKGLVISFLITLISVFLFAILLTCTDISENVIPVSIIILTCVSILIGSLISTKRIRRNGMINGGIIGGIYVITLYIISSILNTGFYVNIHTVLMLVLGIVAGLIGGIIGINL